LDSPSQAAREQRCRLSTTPTERDLRRDDVLTAIQSLLLVVVIATFVVTFILQPFRIPSESMDPTLHVGDFLLMDKQAFAPRGLLDLLFPPAAIKRGEVVVFHYPVNPSEYFIKRVVGLPGDRIRLHDGRVFLNGLPADEPYAFYEKSPPNSFRDNFPMLHSMDPDMDPAWWSTMHRYIRDGELYVPSDRYFVMGDNRNDSVDSRFWGFVPRDALVGRPMVVYFSIAQPAAKTTWTHRLAGFIKNARIVR
jgi:signal peptidase I